MEWKYLMRAKIEGAFAVNGVHFEGTLQETARFSGAGRFLAPKQAEARTDAGLGSEREADARARATRELLARARYFTVSSM